MSLELIHTPQEKPSDPGMELDPYAHIELSRMIGDAACGSGTVQIDPVDLLQERYHSVAHDNSEHPVIHMAGVPLRDLDRVTSQERAHLRTDDTSVIAQRFSSVVEGVYPTDIYSQLMITDKSTDRDPETPIWRNVIIQRARDGKYIDNPIPTLNGKPMTEEDISATKAYIAKKFGLTYEPPKMRSYHQDPEKNMFTSPETEQAVNEMIFAFEQQGLKGNKLKRAVLTALHPDKNPEADTQEMFQYAETLIWGE